MKKRILLIFSVLTVFSFAVGAGDALTGKAHAAKPEKAAGTVATEQKAVRALDEAALKRNMHSRIVKTVTDQGLPMTPAFQAFTPEQIVVAKKIPFAVGDETMFLVSLTFKAPQQLGGAKGASSEDQTLVVAVDATGTYQFDNIIEIATNANLLLPAKREVTKAALPASFGDTVFAGSGKEDVVFVSDPFCPFCRQAFDYFLTKLPKIKTLKIVHRPIAQLHPLAEIVSLVLLHAGETLPTGELFNVTKYAYGPMYDAVPADKREGRQGAPADQKAAEMSVLDGFLKKFPSLQKWTSLEDAYYFIKGKYGQKLAAEQTYIDTLGIQGTPVIYANGYQIRGFNRPELDTIFK
jgi:protein-disulfide isomerase